MASSGDLITLEEARRYIGKATGDNADDKLIEELITAASSEIATYLGDSQVLTPTTYTGMYINGRGSRTLLMPFWPLQTVTELRVDSSRLFQEVLAEWNEVDGTGDYIVDTDLNEIELINGSVFPKGRHTVKASFTSGYTAVPDWAKQACRLTVSSRFAERQALIRQSATTGEVKSETVGSRSVSYVTSADLTASSSVGGSSSGLPAEAVAILMPHRVPSMAVDAYQ